MTEKQQIALKTLSIVENDSAVDFQTLIDTYEGVSFFCFGRFPILSLIYLYGARKIAAKFEKQIIAENRKQEREFEKEQVEQEDKSEEEKNQVSLIASRPNYIVQFDEPLKAYNKFRKRAGVLLYRYPPSSIISPSEMLAAIGETDYLKKKFSDFNLPKKTQECVVSLYQRKGQKASISSDAKSLRAPSQKPPLLQSKVLSYITLAIFCFVAIFTTLLSVIFVQIGFGTESRPFLISSIDQLIAASSSENGYFLLTTDLVFPDNLTIEDFSAHLDGGGNTLTREDNIPFFNTVSGTLYNFTVELGEREFEIDDDFAFLTIYNTGTIRNVEININATITAIPFGEQDKGILSIAVFTAQNRGNIEYAVIDGTVTIHSTNQREYSFGGFATSNHGRIFASSTSPYSEFIADTVSLGGIAFHNTITGSIVGTQNHAKVLQTTDADYWNPHAAGIAMINEGGIINSRNFGNITAISERADSANNLVVRASGIAAINRGLIERSKSIGDITARGFSSRMEVDVGGIVGLNQGNGRIINAGASGQLAAEGSAAVFMGGIAAYFNEGTIADSFSFVAVDAQPHAFVGGLVGAVDVEVRGQFYFQIRLQNNYFLNREQIVWGIDAGWTGIPLHSYRGFLGFIEGYDFDISRVNTLQELQNSEVWFT